MTSFHAVYLLRNGNPLSWTRRFLRSYARTRVPTDVSLILLLKGFEDGKPSKEVDALLEKLNIKAESFAVSDEGYDLEAYRKIVQAFPDKSLLFLNSHSELLHKTALEDFQTAVRNLGEEALIGASGSWECPAHFGLAFPNPHIRTTGFLARAQDYLEACKGHDLTTKGGCHAFESGPQSLTHWFKTNNRPVAVVTKGGESYPTDKWPQSRTFRLAHQENLLIGDNRSRKYQVGTRKRRRHHATHSWGDYSAISNTGLASFLKRNIMERLKQLGWL